MYWSVFLFLPAITWQRHLWGEWMSDAWSVCSSIVAASVHWGVERWWGRRRDNAVINSVWTSSVCMQGSPLGPPGHRSVRNLLFLWLLSFFCRYDRNMQRRLSGSCWQMHVASHSSSTHFGFQKGSCLIWAPFSQWNPTLCGQGFQWLSVWRCCTSNDQYILHNLMGFFWQLKVFMYLPCSMECQTWYYPWSHAFKVIALYNV